LGDAIKDQDERTNNPPGNAGETPAADALRQEMEKALRGGVGPKLARFILLGSPPTLWENTTMTIGQPKHCLRPRAWRVPAAVLAVALLAAAQPKPTDEPVPPRPAAVDPAPKSVVLGVAFSPDGKQLALACEEKVVRIYDWPSGKQRTLLEGFKARVWTAAFSPDGKLLASCTGEYSRPEDPAELKLWDLSTGKEKATLEGHKGLVFSATFSPDGKTLISTGWDGTVRLWDVARGKESAVLTGHQGPVRLAVYAPDNRSFATGGFDGTVRFWDAATSKPLKTITAHEGGVQCLAFSPDGRRLATCDRPLGARPTGTIKLWDLSAGKELARFEGIKGSVLSLAFSPDGAMLAACGGLYGEGGEVKLFEVASGKVRASFDGHKEWVECVCFTPDGRTLVSAGGFTRGRPGEVHAWAVGELRGGKKPEHLTAQRLRALWDGLADRDAAAAYQAILELSAVPADAVPFLKDSLGPVEPADPKRVAELIADLDNDDFDVRERASQELDKVAEAARPALQQANAKTKSAEVRRRTESLLKGLEFPPTSPEQLRRARAVEVLAACASPAAKGLLQELARGAEGALLPEQARAALDRLERQGKQP